jgi:hypothetical protein
MYWRGQEGKEEDPVLPDRILGNPIPLLRVYE